MENLKPVLESLDGVIANLDSALKPTSTDKTAPPPNGAPSAPQNPTAEPEATEGGEKPVKAKKKKEKKEKKPKAPPAPALPIEATQFNQCDLRIGRIATVAPHPEADGLYALRIAYSPDAAPEETKSVCAGLRKFIPEEEMRDRLVVTICNLKPRKLRGVDSEAMILAGSVVSGGEKETVVPLAAPEGAVEGDLVAVSDLEGERAVVDGKFVSSKVWDKVVQRLAVRDKKACYDGKTLVVGTNPVPCALPDGAEIH